MAFFHGPATRALRRVFRNIGQLPVVLNLDLQELSKKIDLAVHTASLVTHDDLSCGSLPLRSLIPRLLRFNPRQ